MFDNTLIKAELSGLVGFKNPANPKFAILNSENQASLSGLFATSNPYCKIEYLHRGFDYSRMTDAQFNAELKNIKETSAINICSLVFDIEAYVDRGQIYSNPFNKVEEFTLPAGFCGYIINIDKEESVAFVINKAIFEMVEAGVTKLLIFNSNHKQPIHTVDIAYDAFYSIENVDFIVNNTGYYKGSFAIGFICTNQKTYKRGYNDSNEKNFIKFLDIRNVFVEGHSDETTIFDLNDAREVTDYCGFNLDITIVNDYTELISTNRFLFARAIYLDIIISCLNIYAASLRSNDDQRTAEELYREIMLQIEGTRPDDNVISIQGLRPQIVYEISEIKKQLFNLKEAFFGRGYFVDTQD